MELKKIGPAEVLKNCEWYQNADCGSNAVGVGGFRIKGVDAFLFQRRHNIGAYHWESRCRSGSSDWTAECRHISDKNIFQHHLFVRSKASPVLALLQEMKDVILIVEQKPLLVGLFDLDEAADGKIDNGRCNVAGMDAIVEQGSGFGG